MEKYSLSPVQWTNGSFIKPSRELLANKIIWVEDNLSFKPDPNQYGIATMTHKLGNITYVQWNNKNYLVESCIELNNGLFKYNLESDVWVNLVIPFFENLPATAPTPLIKVIRVPYDSVSHNRKTKYIDPIISQYPIEQTNLFSPPSDNLGAPKVSRDFMVSNSPGNQYKYTTTPKQPDFYIEQFNGVEKYYVFTTKFNSFNISTINGNNILAQQYLVFPVIDRPRYVGAGKQYNNYEGELQNLAVANSTSFIGVFRGPTINVFNNYIKKLNSENASTGYKWIEMQYSSTGGKWVLCFETGERYAGIHAYEPINAGELKIIGDTTIPAQLFNNYANHNTQTKLAFNFSGSGFIFYPLNLYKPFSDLLTSESHYVSRDALYGTFGSYLPYIGDDYKSYVSQNASQINTGLISAGAGLVGVVASAASIPFTGGLGVAAVIGAGTSLTNSIIGLKGQTDNLSKMKRHNTTKPIQSNINDIANYSFFTNTTLSIARAGWTISDNNLGYSFLQSQYGVSFLTSVHHEDVISMYRRHNGSVITKYAGTYQIDIPDLRTHLSLYSGITKLEKNLIEIELSSHYCVLDDIEDWLGITLKNKYNMIAQEKIDFDKCIIDGENEVIEEWKTINKSAEEWIKTIERVGKENEKEDI